MADSLNSSNIRASQYEVPSLDLIEIHYEEAEKEWQQGQDFTSMELVRLKIHLQNKQHTRAISLLERTPCLNDIPLYRLFSVYFSVVFNSRKVFEWIMGHDWPHLDLLSSIEQKAWRLINSAGFGKLTSDEEDRNSLGHLVMFKAFDFNIKEVFGLVIDEEKQFFLRLEDIETLLNYKHYGEIAKTFMKPIMKRNILDLFLDKDAHFRDQLDYSTFNLCYFLEVMIMQEYSNDDILSLCSEFMDYLQPNQVVRVFIKYDQLQLVQWVESHPGYNFSMEQLTQAIEQDAFDVALYLVHRNGEEVHRQAHQLNFAIINSFSFSVKNYCMKLYFMNMFFKVLKVPDLKNWIIILRKKLLKGDFQENPLLYSLNPILTSLKLVEMLQKTRNQFYTFVVYCQTLEAYLEDGIFKFVSLIQSEEVASFMLLEKDMEGQDSLDLLSKFKFYRIIQQRNVTEAVMQVYKSKYAIENSQTYFPLSEPILRKESIFNKADIEEKHRLRKQWVDRSEVMQGSFMLHIYKHNILVRYNYELLFIIILTMLNAAVMTLVMLEQTRAMDYSATQYFVEASNYSQGNYTEGQYSEITDACNYQKDAMDFYYVCVKGLSVLFFTQLGFGVKIITDKFLASKTKRKINFLTFEYILYFLLSLISSFILYLSFRPVKSQYDPFFEYCATIIPISSRSFFRNEFVMYFISWDSYTDLIYIVNNILLFTLMLLKLQMTVQLGPLIKIMMNIFSDFFAMISIYVVLIVVYMFVGMFLFAGLEDFSSSRRTVQLLFSAHQGNFNFTIFQQSESHDNQVLDFIVHYSVGNVYLISWLILSNIMMLNLLIAIFSNTYNKLFAEKEGQFMKQIIDIRSRYEFDPYYSAFTVTTFPLNFILLPLIPVYACIKSKELDEMVLMILYFLDFLLFQLPIYIGIVQPILILLLYLKCLINKFYILVFARDTGRTFKERLTRFLIFMIFGLPYFTIFEIFDVINLFYILLKPEQELTLRYQREEVLLTMNDVGSIRRHLKSYVKRGKLTKPEYTKIFVSKLRQDMEVDQAISLILHRGNEEKLMNTLKIYSTVKTMLIDSSIKKNDQFILYPDMLAAIFEEINMFNRIAYIQEQLWNQATILKSGADDNFQDLYSMIQSVKSPKRKLELKCPESIIDGKVRSVAYHFMLAQVGSAARAFVMKENEQQQNLIQQALDKDEEELKKGISQIKSEMHHKLEL